VEVESVEGVNAGRGARTDSNGGYRLDGFVVGAMTVRASAAGYVTQTLGVSFTGNQTLNFDLSQPQPTRFRYFGVVRDGLGSLVPGTFVRSGNGNCDFSAVTDSGGRYDSTSNCNSVVLAVQPPNGYEGVLAQFQTPTPPGERNFTTRRIGTVLLAAPSQIQRSDGTLFYTVSVSVSFDDGSNRRLASQDFVTLQSSNGSVVRTRGADGNSLSIEGVSVGTASVTATYWSVVSSPVSVTVVSRGGQEQINELR